MAMTASLTREQRAWLADRLQSRLDDLIGRRALELQSLSEVDAAHETLVSDADDASQRAGEHEVEGIVLDLDSAEFNALEDALQRIHADGYGVCRDCQLEIPFTRLQAEPQTTRCAACQTVRDLELSP